MLSWARCTESSWKDARLIAIVLTRAKAPTGEYSGAGHARCAAAGGAIYLAVALHSLIATEPLCAYVGQAGLVPHVCQYYLAGIGIDQTVAG